MNRIKGNACYGGGYWKQPQPITPSVWIDTPTAGVTSYRNSYNMSNNKNENQETAALLQALVKSPIMDENYYLTTSNLCQAIQTIADSVGELIDDVLVSLEQKTVVNAHYLEWTKERIWQIRSLSEVIDDRQSHEDFERIVDAVKEFEKMRKASV